MQPAAKSTLRASKRCSPMRAERPLSDSARLIASWSAHQIPTLHLCQNIAWTSLDNQPVTADTWAVFSSIRCKPACWREQLEQKRCRSDHLCSVVPDVMIFVYTPNRWSTQSFLASLQDARWTLETRLRMLRSQDPEVQHFLCALQCWQASN